MVLAYLANTFLNKPHQPQTEGTVYAALTDKNFYYVRDAYSVKLYGKDTGMSFDLKHQELFGAGIAIKDGKLYGDQLDGSTLTEYYENEEDFFLDATRHIPIHKASIKYHGYQQVVQLSDIWSHFKSSDITNSVIEDFKKNKLTQLRITYNKQFLPTKIEGFYRSGEAKGWKDLFYISYPYHNQTDFDKAQDSYLNSLPTTSPSEDTVEDD